MVLNSKLKKLVSDRTVLFEPQIEPGSNVNQAALHIRQSSRDGATP